MPRGRRAAVRNEPTLPLETRARLTTGSDLWSTHAEPLLDLPSLLMSDGPNGVRGGTYDERLSARCSPCGTALASSWDEDLVHEVGELLGEEAATMAVDVLLGPMINLHRSPLGGRSFECYGEDPLLSGRIAAAWVKGLQGCGVAAAPKHFVGNDCEKSRTTVDCIVDERALRELYLVPFECVVQAGAWTMMAAYNRVNGVHATEHRELIRGLLKGEWDWDGVVISDWFAAHDTVGSALAGLDLEMPAGQVLGVSLADAVRRGSVPESELDDKVERLRRLAGRVRRQARPASAPDEPLRPSPGGVDAEPGRPEAAALLTRAAAAGFVLLKNADALLPLQLDPGAAHLAVIGANAVDPCIQGGGSSSVNLGSVRTPLSAIRERFSDIVPVEHEQGCAPRSTYRPLENFDVEAADRSAGTGLTITYIPRGVSIDEAATEMRRSSSLSWFDGIPTFPCGSAGEVRMTGWLTPRWSGVHHFSVRGSGPSRVVVDGVEVATLRALSDPSDMFAPFYCDDAGVGSVHLSAGHPVLIEAVMHHEAIGVPLFEVGCREPGVPHRLERAVELAAAAQAAVLVVGTSSDLEAEGRDRTTTVLPGGQDALIEAVLDANRRTVVVVNAGSAVDMPWIDKAAAVLYTWFPGHGFAEALAAVLAGDLEPGGRLPLTLAASSDHYPAFSTLPDAQGRRHYHESVLIGYRHFDATGIEPSFAFGHGLGYTTFDYTALVLSTDALSVGQTLSVRTTVTNIGSRRGKAVPQLYVSPAPCGAPRPPRELKGFRTVHLDPSESSEVSFDLGPRAFAHWDPEGRRWRVAPGEYAIHLGSSSRDILQSAVVRLEGYDVAAGVPVIQP